jgi:hypothetical protein
VELLTGRHWLLVDAPSCGALLCRMQTSIAAGWMWSRHDWRQTVGALKSWIKWHTIIKGDGWAGFTYFLGWALSSCRYPADRVPRIQAPNYGEKQGVQQCTAVCPTALGPASLCGGALVLPCILRLRTPPPYAGGLRDRHTSHGSGPHLPAREGSRAFYPTSKVASRLSRLDSRVVRASSSRPSLMSSSPSLSYNLCSSSSTTCSR